MKKFLYGAFFGAFIFKPIYDFGRLFLAKFLEDLFKPPSRVGPTNYTSSYNYYSDRNIRW